MSLLVGNRRLAAALTVVLLAVAAAVAGAPAAGDAPAAPIGHAGWITDSSGRVLIVSGVTMACKLPPYAPDATGRHHGDGHHEPGIRVHSSC